MDGYFDATEGKGIFAKRLLRILQFGRLPFSLMGSIISYYGKKVMGKSGSDKERANNYYFLTLIHANCEHVKLDNGTLIFKQKNGPTFFARHHPDSDLEVFNQVWGRREYKQATEILKAENHNGTPVNIIDAGANVGYSTLFFLQEFPDGQIVSIEPEEDNFSMLAKNVDVNKLGDQVDLRKNGIWHKTCNLKVVNTFRDGCSWSAQVVETEELSALKAISLADIVREKGWQVIDLLKIDIEGSEKQLFDDDAGIRRILSITKVLALEVHDEMADRAKIYNVLQECGFTYFDHNDLTIAYRQGIAV